MTRSVGAPPTPASSSTPGAPVAPAAAPLVLVAFVAGAATMSVELAAVRVLAPWYGTSSAVWTNVIGVVLVSLALGYLLGARLSARADPRRALGLALVLAGVATAWLPALARPAARAFLPEGLTLEEAGASLLWGSLASALCLFSPSALALGAVAPLATECLQRVRGGSAGAAGGRVLCASTLGSLAGTFATTYVLVPRAGLSATFLGAGAALVACGLPFLLAARARAGAVASALALAGALGLARVGPPPLAADMRLLEARETRYQSARVVETGVGDERLRFLQVNEGFGSFQSVWQVRTGLLPEGHYYNTFALPPWWQARPGAWRLLVLGLGAGTAWRVLEGALPPEVALETVGVEIDPGVVELGRRWMELPDGDASRVVVADVDARAALRLLPRRFDQIVLDAYQNQMEIPPQLASVEFFADCAQLLARDGWMTVNVGAFGFDDPVLVAVAGTMAAGFDRRVLALRVPFARNIVLVARVDAEPLEPGADGWVPAGAPVSRHAGALALPGMWRWFERPAAPALTDDKNPIEALQRRSIELAREHAP